MNTLHSKRRSLAVAITAVSLAAAGCADMNLTPTQKSTAIGTGAGLVVGGLIDGGKGAAIGGLVGAAGGYAWSKYMQDKKTTMEKATVGTGVSVTQTPDNLLKLNIPSDVSFDSGRADIKANLRPILDQFAGGLQGQPNTDVRIIGHTDSTGSDAVNNPLSMQRAQATRDYLASRGVDPARIQIAGRGEHEPIADNTSDAGRARNRRVEIYLGDRATMAAR